MIRFGKTKIFVPFKNIQAIQTISNEYGIIIPGILLKDGTELLMPYIESENLRIKFSEKINKYFEIFNSKRSKLSPDIEVTQQKIEDGVNKKDKKSKTIAWVENNYFNYAGIKLQIT